MARPLRIEYPGALYHVITRGDRKELIYEDDTDKRIFLNLLGDVIGDYGWSCSTYCLMPNHYHLVIETPNANLSSGMRQLNGIFTQVTNRRHERVGHLFQGRYKAILVDREPYFLQLSRYVVLNPVRAQMVGNPSGWPWSSYRGMLNPREAPVWLDRSSVLRHFSQNGDVATRKYHRFVTAGMTQTDLNKRLNRQIFLGDDEFVSGLLSSSTGGAVDRNIPKQQQLAPPQPLEYFSSTFEDRNEGIIAAYSTGEFSYEQIAQHYGVHFTTVGRVVRGAKGSVG